MSFILDALKKSEIERQRQTEPGLMDAGTMRRRSRLPTWAALLGLLLAINIIVLLVVLMRNRAPARPAPASRADAAAVAGAVNSSPSAAAGIAAPGPAVPGVSTQGASAHFSPLDPAPVYAPEIPVPATAGTAAGDSPPISTVPRTLPSVAPSRSPASRAVARALHRPDPVLSDTDASAAAADNDELLPSISEINLTGAQALPELHLDVHVYATKPGDRFVYINMRKYRQGAVLQEGPAVELIRRDGVILNFQGLRFLLPRQS
jgi:general secretion pathway protein B